MRRGDQIVVEVRLEAWRKLSMPASKPCWIDRVTELVMCCISREAAAKVARTYDKSSGIGPNISAREKAACAIRARSVRPYVDSFLR